MSRRIGDDGDYDDDDDGHHHLMIVWIVPVAVVGMMGMVVSSMMDDGDCHGNSGTVWKVAFRILWAWITFNIKPTVSQVSLCPPKQRLEIDGSSPIHFRIKLGVTR